MHPREVNQARCHCTPRTATADDRAIENEQSGWNGGFDVILGNPPWERVKLQEKEFFAGRDPEIANALFHLIQNK